MSEVIRFLESQGSNPAHSIAQYQADVNGLAIDAAQREALLGRNGQRLTELLGGRAAMRCMVVAPEEA